MAHSSLLPHTVASAAGDGTVKVWAGPQLGQLAHTLRPARQAAGCGVCFSSVEPHQLALASADCCAYVYDLRRAQEPLHVRQRLLAGASCMACSPRTLAQLHVQPLSRACYA